jgi:hypothetical protein
MKSIFIVTSGDYSSYRINGVYSTKEKAEQSFPSKHRRDYGVEEWVLDAKVDLAAKGYREWFIEFDKDGNVTQAADSAPDESSAPSRVNVNGWSGGICVYQILAGSRAAAIKIASEKRAQLLAELARPKGRKR